MIQLSVSRLLTLPDLQPANILVSVTGGISDGKFMQPPELAPVKWLNGVKQDDSAPEYLVPSQRRRGQLDNVPLALVVKIGDLGGGKYAPTTFCNSYPS